MKVDDICHEHLYVDDPYGAAEVEMIRRAIDKAGRPMCLSLSPGPAVIEKAWHLEHYANMWRITDDFWDDWKLLLDMFDRCEDRYRIRPAEKDEFHACGATHADDTLVHFPLTADHGW